MKTTKNTIWMYWENSKNKKKPAYLGLCLETIKKYNKDADIKVLSEETIEKYLPHLRKDWKDIFLVPHKADYLRAQLLYKYGGIWLDSDIIVLKSLNPIFKLLKKHDFVGYGVKKGEPSIGFFAARKGCKLLELWIQGMDKKLNHNNSLDWEDLGYKILHPLSRNYSYYHLSHKLCSPISWNNWKILLSKKVQVIDIINSETIMVQLFNKYLFKVLYDTKEEQIMQGDRLLSKLFRKSLVG